MVPVTVRTFSSETVVGTSNETVGYFRSWNHKNTGGEIGRIFRLSYEEYLMDKIKFKINNMCNSCLIRLHIRSVVDGRPAQELLSDSVFITVNRLTLDDKPATIDLSKYELVFSQEEIFIGLEVINCKPYPGEKDCSLSFTGNEEGYFHYRSSLTDYWEKTDAFSIYLKLYLRY